MLKRASVHIGALAAPRLADSREQMQSEIQQAVLALNEVARLVNAVESWKVKEAFQDLLEGEASVGTAEFSARLRGVQIPVAIGAIRDVLGGLNAVVTVSDPQAMRRMFDERLGWFGITGESANVLSSAGNILRGTIASVSYLCAATTKAAGYAAEAAQLVATTRRFADGIAKPLAILDAIKGLVSLAHPQSTPEQRISGMADIMVGAGSWIREAVGAGLTAGALALRVDLGILRVGVEASRGLVWMGLNRCYERMALDGAAIAKYGNRVLAGQAIIDAERDPGRRALLEESVDEAEFGLRAILSEFLTDASSGRNDTDPGKWAPLRRSFAACGPPPSTATSRAQLIQQAHQVLGVIEKAFAGVDQVLNECTVEAWRQYG